MTKKQPSQLNPPITQQSLAGCCEQDAHASKQQQGEFAESDGELVLDKTGTTDTQEKNAQNARQRASAVAQQAKQMSDPIDQAAAESFPASDPPSYNGSSVSPSSE
jgi:hypothetical protein